MVPAKHSHGFRYLGFLRVLGIKSPILAESGVPNRPICRSWGEKSARGYQTPRYCRPFSAWRYQTGRFCQGDIDQLDSREQERRFEHRKLQESAAARDPATTQKRAPQPEGAFCQSTSRFAALGRLWLRVRAPLTFFAKEKPLFRALCFRQKNRRPVARGVKTPPNLPSPGKMTPRAAGYVLRTEG